MKNWIRKIFILLAFCTCSSVLSAFAYNEEGQYNPYGDTEETSGEEQKPGNQEGQGENSNLTDQAYPSSMGGYGNTGLSEDELEKLRLEAEIDKLNEEIQKLKDSKVESEIQRIKNEIYAKNKEIDKLNAEIEEKKKNMQKENSDNLESQNSAKPGDPVKATEGSYEQSETDFTSGSSIELKVTRNYSSAESITSGFGYGWTTNLDQRIILGVEKNARQLYEAMLEYNQRLEESVREIKNLILRSYGITSLDTSQIDSAISRAEEIGRELEELGESGRADGTISSLESVKESLEKDLETLRNYENELELRKDEAEYYYKNVVIRSERNHAANRYVLFAGTPSYYEETGADTITVIDENGYPHMMRQTGETEWKEADEKTYIKCVAKADGYELYEANGTLRKFDSNGLIVSITDRNKNEIRIKRDSSEKIIEAETSDGEKFCFEYSGNCISKITNTRSPDENAVYTYSGNRLVSVKDTDGDTVTMEYDSDGRMTSLNKCDGSSVKFEYGEQSSDGKILTTKTTNEEGHSERFEYFRSEKRTDYIDHDGNRTSYFYDEHHRTVKEIRPDGNVIQNEYDNSGNLIKVNENGNVTRFEYDERGNKTGAAYSDGSREQWTYDRFGLVTSYTDRDGVKQEILRDENGNVTGFKNGGKTVYLQGVNSKGQVINRTVFGQNTVRTEYEYDDNGNLIRGSSGQSETKYEYDARNRIRKEIRSGKCVSEFSYENDPSARENRTVRKDYNGLETTWVTNGRKDITKVIQKDSVTGTVHQTRIEYDRRHLPLKVYSGNGENEKALSGYLYTKEGNLKAEVSYGNESRIKFYEYKNGVISEIKQFKAASLTEQEEITEEKINQLLLLAGDKVYVQKYDIKIQNENRKLLTVTDALGNSSLFEYDGYGKLVKTTDGNGDSLQNTYTFGGRITKEQNAFGGWYEYGYSTEGFLTRGGEQNGRAVSAEYYPDGSIRYITDRYGKTTCYNYDSQGRTESIQSEGQKIWYEYDNFDRVIKQTVGNSPNEYDCVYYAEYEYSDDGRTVMVNEGGKYRTVYELNAFGNVIKQIDGNNNERLFVYDSLNRMTESYDGYNNKTTYEYNALGIVSKIILPDGSVTKYEYNCMGQISKVTDDCGIVYTASYDKAGRLVKEKSRADAEKTYEYDRAGRVTKVLCGGEVVESYTYGMNNRTVTVKDGNGNNYLYNYDSYGRLVSEKNRNGLEQNYFYDEGGELKSKNSFDGYSTTINYSSDRTVRTVRYSDGSENRFVYDMIGNIIEAENVYGKTEYSYDKGGRLILQKEMTVNEEVAFEYDAAGNRTKLLSANRETVYTYGKNNEVKKIFDNKQRVSIELDYNKNGKEVLRRFGNGTEEKTLYDKSDRIIAKYQITAENKLLWAEGYVYEADGKRSLTVNQNGQITLYEYNNKGQLSKVYYPYDKNQIQNLQEEAQINGLPVNAEITINKLLTLEQRKESIGILDKIHAGLSGQITNMQIFIEESYEYDANGNRIAKITPYGKINYTYDKENCLLSSGSGNQAYINYLYDKNGNLLQEKSSGKIKNYAYDYQNRLIYCDSKDEISKKYVQSNYAYDALGRRIIVQDIGENPIRTIYDGFTFDVVKQSVTFENGMFSDRFETGIRYNKNGKPTGDRYRYIDESYSHSEDRYRRINEDYSTASGRYKGSRTLVSINGRVAAQNTDDNEVSYFATDILGSVVGVSDAWGACKKSYSYDAFGNLIAGDLNGAENYGYTGKPKDPVAGLYNYGFRDYSPQTARFTTIDPIRDGNNWFNYCNGDSVNFVDLWGLEILKPVLLYMQDQRWGDQVTGDPKATPSGTKKAIKMNGCYLVGYCEAAITLTGNEFYSPDFFNQYKELFDSYQNFNSNKASEMTGLTNFAFYKGTDEDLTNKINELNESTTQYVVMAQVPYDIDGDLHWVCIYGDIDDDGYINTVGTSKSDYNSTGVRSQIDTWDFSDGVKIKVSDINQLRAFTKNK